jgi:hypothetical protein
MVGSSRRSGSFRSDGARTWNHLDKGAVSSTVNGMHGSRASLIFCLCLSFVAAAGCTSHDSLGSPKASSKGVPSPVGAEGQVVGSFHPVDATAVHGYSVYLIRAHQPVRTGDAVVQEWSARVAPDGRFSVQVGPGNYKAWIGADNPSAGGCEHVRYFPVHVGRSRTTSVNLRCNP